MWSGVTINAQTDMNSCYFRLFGIPTYYSDAVKNVFRLDSTRRDKSSGSKVALLRLKGPESLESQIDKELVKLYMNHPELIQYHELQFDSIQVVEKKRRKIRDIDDLLQDAPLPSALNDMNLDLDMKIKRPNFWKLSGNFSTKFSQNYFSENWHQGGNNTQNLLSSLRLEAKYDDTRKLQWENRLDMRLGFLTTNSDTCHTYIIDNDRLEAYSKIGYKMNKKGSWYYTLSLNAVTQFTPGYKANQKEKFSDFLSPLDFFLSAGIDYKPKLKKGSLSVAMLPLSYKFRLINSDLENIHNAYGMKENFRQDWGSRLEVNANLTLAKNLKWRGKLYAYTSYKYVEGELENVFNYAFSKYLSAEVYTLWRFDDNRNKKYYDRNLGYFQFKEYFTFGLDYSF